MTLYHYTSEAGHRGIKADRQITASTNGKYGPGVYLTDLNPDENARDVIARELYRAGGNKNLRKGKLRYHVALEIPDNHVRKVRDHIFIYGGDGGDYGCCLRLDDYEIVSQGDDEAWKEALSGMALVAIGVAAVAATEKAVGLYHSALNGRERRLLELKTKLQGILVDRLYKCPEGVVKNATSRLSVEPTSDKGVCIVCNECSASASLSEIYYGGILYASTICTEDLLTRLSNHEKFHNALADLLEAKQKKIPQNAYAVKTSPNCIYCNRCHERVVTDDKKVDVLSALYIHEFLYHELPYYLVYSAVVGGVLIAVASWIKRQLQNP